jgi:DNA-directed RNA polymerase alpha subunit
LTSGDIKLPYPFYIVDKKQYIATVSQDIKLEIFLCLELIPNEKFYDPVSILPFATFIIENKNYMIQNVNHNTFSLEDLKFEYLNIEIWTNASIHPSYALRWSACMAWQFFNQIIKTTF